jgi:alpha-tubulin suppressor-like RCC1 family protein
MGSGILSVSLILVVLTALPLGCTKQNAGDISQELADTLTDNFGFEGSQKQTGKPITGSGGKEYPQILDYTAPVELYDGLVFKVNFHSDFTSTSKKIVGAQVFVEGSAYYLNVPGTYSGGMLTLSGQFSWNDLFSKYGSNPSISMNLIAADILTGPNTPDKWLNPVIGLPVKWQPSVHKAGINPVSDQELTDLLTGSGFGNIWGALPDNGQGTSQPSPPSLKLITSGTISFNMDFSLSADLSGDLSKVTNFLLQVEKSKTSLSRAITADEKAAKKIVMVLRFSTEGSNTGALSLARALGIGSDARAQTTYVLKAALESEGGDLSKPDKLPVEISGNPVAQDGGYPDSGHARDAGSVSISPITPENPVVTAGMSISLHATVTGTKDTQILWSATAGTISTDGIFLAPEEPDDVTITATSHADQSKYSTVVAHVYAAAKILDFHATKDSILYGDKSSLYVEYEGTGADVDPGFKDVKSGDTLDVSPPATTDYKLSVRNDLGDAVTSTATVTVAQVQMDPLAPANPAAAPGDSVLFSTRVTGALDTGVKWKATLGSISVDGMWTAPAVEGDAVITATSKADSKTSASTTAYVRKRTMLASGGNHSCFMLDTGEVKCWGDNSSGQIGSNNQTQYVVSPEYVVNPTVGHLTGVKAIALGSSHSCALMSDTGVKCWGAGGNGQLGNNTKSNSQTPVDVKINADLTLTGAKSIHIGANHSCAVMNDGTMRCWGANSYGQIGDGGKTDQPVAVQVMNGASPLSGVAAAAAGGGHTCAMAGAGVKCWGENSYGQLGNGGKGQSTVPVDVLNTDLSPFSGATAISLGSNHSCALMTSSGLKCWGDGTYYQLGNGVQGSQGHPVDVQIAGGTPATGFTSVNAGYQSTCGRLTGSQGMCWGYNSWGQSGTGKYDTNIIKPTAISDETLAPIPGIKAIAPGNTHACLQHSDNSVQCWGWNNKGQIGNGQGGDPKTLAEDVHNLSSGVLSVAGGGYFTCARMSGDTAKCWGRNDYGQLGDSTTIRKPQPVDVINADTSKLLQIIQIAAGSYHACAKISDNTVYCWGQNDSGQVGSNSAQNSIVNPEHVVTSGGKNLSPVTSAALGGTHSCALMNDTSVQCWGSGSYGQLGDNTTTSKRAYAAPVSSAVGGNLTGVVSLALGTAHSCATLSSKSAVCWGWNSDRQLGNGSTTNSSTPVTVVTNANQTPLTGAIAISAGYAHSCALIEGGTVSCWGLNSQGQLGNGNTAAATYPISVKVGAGALLTGVASVESGDTHTCALLTNGTLWCWGYNLHGELGIGTTTNSLYAVQVSGITSPLSYSAGMFHTCAVTAGGGAKCWGWGNLGALGNLNWSAFPLDASLSQ